MGSKRRQKTAKKTARRAPPSPRNGNRLPLGAHPGNTGGKKGRSGRRPRAITVAASELVDKHDLLDEAARIAKRAKRPGDRLAAIRFLVEYGHGKPTQHVTMEGDFEHHHTESPREALDRELARLATRQKARDAS